MYSKYKLFNLIFVLSQVHRVSSSGQERAHAVVKVTVEDKNDNSPVFVNQPYHAVLVHDASLGHVVKQVKV